MKNKKLFFATIIGAIFLVSCNSAEQKSETTTETTALPETNYTVATESSSVKWKGVMLGVKEHFGTLNLTNGSFTLADGKVKSGNFTADMTTIKPTDSNYDEKSGYTAEKLVAHLSSPDFFDVANHPTATFVIDSVNGSEATGTFTIRGTSNKETVKNVTITQTEGVATLTGTLTFDRKKYGVMFDMPVKEMVISNDIELSIELSGKAQ